MIEENFPIQDGLYYFDNEKDAIDMLYLYFEDNEIELNQIEEPMEGKMNSMEDEYENKSYTIVYWRKNGIMKIQVGFPND